MKDTDLKTPELQITKDTRIQDDIDFPHVLVDLKYICKSTSLITDALQKGFDVAQLPNGDIIVTEVKTINTQYSWDQNKQKMIRTGQN